MLPLFVYGTLIPGQPNDHYVLGHIVAQEPAWFEHGRLFTFDTFPMLIEARPPEGEPITGRLLWLDEAVYGRVLSQLDELEEYNPAAEADSPYVRCQRLIHTADGRTHLAWVYLGQPHFLPPHQPHIPGGDWVAYVAEQASQDNMATWWREHGVKLLFNQER